MNEILAQTPKGTITAKDAGYPNEESCYPGISIEINGLEAVRVEYDPLKKKIQLIAWDIDLEEPTIIHELL